MAVRVRAGFSFDDPRGVPVTLMAGRLFADDHPYVLAHPMKFEAADDAAEHLVASAGAVETATAAPGAARTISRPRKGERPDESRA